MWDRPHQLPRRPALSRPVIGDLPEQIVLGHVTSTTSSAFTQCIFDSLSGEPKRLSRGGGSASGILGTASGFSTRERGYAYLGITEHSRRAHYAGGLTIEEVAAQRRQIDRLNRRYGPSFHVFKGIESDILADGSLDYPEEVLAGFDLVIASVHSKFRMGRKEQTDRIVRAVENPHTTILGHVTGRQLMRRPGYELDMERVLKACAGEGVAIEINAHPWRLDMDWRWCERALELGCMFSINPDAHSTEEIDNIRWGILMARKGAVPKERVLNTLGRGDFDAYLEKRRRGKGRPIHR